MSKCEYESGSLCFAACGALQKDQITLPYDHLPVRWHLSLIGEIPVFELNFVRMKILRGREFNLFFFSGTLF